MLCEWSVKQLRYVYMDAAADFESPPSPGTAGRTGAADRAHAARPHARYAVAGELRSCYALRLFS